ncbi:transposase, partial [Kurthia huakuii]
MTIVKQMRLFDIHELMEMESSRRFDAILATFDLQPILQLFRKTTMYGAPRELNYGAMVQSLVIRIVERIPTVKDLVKRLKYDILFRLDCGFLLSDCIPSEASYSRMVSVISGSDAFVQMNDKVIQIAFTEG